ncbi:hypothetical protein CRG98_006577 [Punica granatum]|uniref:Uncharacterized protein n=1 Tax=Punica granatum TaxID=22663 RepID=A0A2I0KYV4_PUNGR|nr:hypothetical protein CRG98_006577 [Punica granatum]
MNSPHCSWGLKNGGRMLLPTAVTTIGSGSLSGILGSPPAEVHYTDSRGKNDNRSYGGKGKNRGKGKGNGGNGGNSGFYGGYEHGQGGGNNRNLGYGSMRGQGVQGRWQGRSLSSSSNPNFAGQMRGEGRQGYPTGHGYNFNPIRDTLAIRPGLFNQPGSFNSRIPSARPSNCLQPDCHIYFMPELQPTRPHCPVLSVQLFF